MEMLTTEHKVMVALILWMLCGFYMFCNTRFSAFGVRGRAIILTACGPGVWAATIMYLMMKGGPALYWWFRRWVRALRHG